MVRKREVAEIVDALLGTWVGVGKGDYPTIDDFAYREQTTITSRADHPALHFDQRTWKQTEAGEAPSHWETGLIVISSDGTVKLHNAQGGRAETMLGTWTALEPGWRIDLRSTGFAGDDRMIESTRVFTIGTDTLSYVHEMGTAAHPSLTLHLKADLTRD